MSEVSFVRADCVPFSCVDSFHIVYNRPNLLSVIDKNFMIKHSKGVPVPLF